MYGPNARSDENCFVIVPLYAVESQPKAIPPIVLLQSLDTIVGHLPFDPPPEHSRHPTYRLFAPC